MILRDKIRVLRPGREPEVIRAYVGSPIVMRDFGGREGISIQERLQAVIPPTEGIEDMTPIEWRGESYVANGPPIVRRKAGKDHHMTVTLRRAIE